MLVDLMRETPGPFALEGELEASFEDLKAKLLRLSLKYQRHYSDAEDAVSETMVQVLEKKDQFQGNSSLSTWIYTICVRKNLEVLRKKRSTLEKMKRFFEHSLSERQSYEDGFVPLREDFQKALAKLDEKERSVFILTVYEELPQREIAQVLEMSVSNVKVTLHRGRKKLMGMLSEYVGE